MHLLTGRTAEERHLPTATINGLKIAYELHGEGDAVALTPGGRYSMDAKGDRLSARTHPAFPNGGPTVQPRRVERAVAPNQGHG